MPELSFIDYRLTRDQPIKPRRSGKLECSLQTNFCLS